MTKWDLSHVCKVGLKYDNQSNTPENFKTYYDHLNRCREIIFDNIQHTFMIKNSKN